LCFIYSPGNEARKSRFAEKVSSSPKAYFALFERKIRTLVQPPGGVVAPVLNHWKSKIWRFLKAVEGWNFGLQKRLFQIAKGKYV
jgi:hypothetical protein